MRPIVVFMPQKEREALLKDGGLPESWLSSFDESGFLDVADNKRPAVFFWPHEITYSDYTLSADPDKPLDIATYLGLDPAAKQEEKQLHERKVYSSFCNTIAVHVAFLEAETPKDISRYLHLNTFKDLAIWGRNFKTALDQKYSYRTNAKHILVVVVKGEEVKTSNDELTQFSDTLKTAGFASCYFLDYDIGRGDSGQQFHASTVWMPMVERLLLYFILAEEQNNLDFSTDFKIKIWQSFECRQPCNFNETYAIEDRLSIVNKILKPNDKPGSIAFRKLDYSNPDKIVQENAHKNLNWNGWSDYPIKVLGETCEKNQRNNQEKWKKLIEDVQGVEKNLRECRTTLSNWLLDPVHKSPALKNYENIVKEDIKSEIEIISEIGNKKENLQEKEADKTQKWSISEAIKNIFKFESERQDELQKLYLRNESNFYINSIPNEETLAEAVKKAQDHYVGLLRGAWWLLLMLPMAGWVIWRAAKVFEAPLYFTITLSVAFAVGGFAMLFLILYLQGLAGYKAVEGLRVAADNADNKFAEKDLESRKLILSARARHCHLVRLGKLAQLKEQFDRVQEVMRKELDRFITRKEEEQIENDIKKEPLQESFEKCIIKLFKSISVDINEDDTPNLGTEIPEKWNEWCKQIKTEIAGSTYNNGYFPASYFSNEIRRSLVDFQKRRRQKKISLVMEDQNGNVLDKLAEWSVTRRNNSFMEGKCFEFASADINDVKNDVKLQSHTVQHFYITANSVNDDTTKNTDDTSKNKNDTWKNYIIEKFDVESVNVEEEYEIEVSNLLDEVKSIKGNEELVTIGLFYREVPVKLTYNSDGVLTFYRIDG